MVLPPVPEKRAISESTEVEVLVEASPEPPAAVWSVAQVTTPAAEMPLTLSLPLQAVGVTRYFLVPPLLMLAHPLVVSVKRMVFPEAGAEGAEASVPVTAVEPATTMGLAELTLVESSVSEELPTAVELVATGMAPVVMPEMPLGEEQEPSYLR